MARFFALLTREWRDARALTVAAAAVALGVTIALNEFFFHYIEPELTARYVVPGLLALYVAALASDLVAGEVATGRIGPLALLPTPLSTPWSAKAAFLVLSGTLFAAWSLLCALGVHVVAGRPEVAGDVLLALPDTLPTYVLVAGFGGAVLFFSTLLQRGFAAALAGLMVIGLATFALLNIRWRAFELDYSRDQMLLAAGTLGIVMALGSRVAFCRAPIHAAGAIRRTLVAFAVPLGILIPAGAGAALALDSWLSLEPDDADVIVESIHPSPDGHYLAVRVVKDGQHRPRLWIVPVDGGPVIRDLHDRPVLDVDVPWTHDGLVRGLTFGGPPPLPLEKLVRWFDPATGRVVRTRTPEWEDAERRGNGPVLGSVGWGKLHSRQTRHDAAWRAFSGYPALQRHPYGVDWHGEDREFPFFSHTRPTLSPVPGFVLMTRDSGVLILHDLNTGTDLVLTEAPKRPDPANDATGRVPQPSGNFSPDGRLIAVYGLDGNHRIASASDGRTVHGPWKKRGAVWPFGLPGPWMIVWGEEARFENQETGAVRVYPGGAVHSQGIYTLPGGRLAIARKPNVVEILGPDGKTIRRLLPAAR